MFSYFLRGISFEKLEIEHIPIKITKNFFYYLAINLILGTLLCKKNCPVLSETKFLPQKCVFDQVSAQTYRPFWVSDSVLYQNQSNGFGCTLYCSTVSNPTKSRCLKKEVQTGFYLLPLGSTEKQVSRIREVFSRGNRITPWTMLAM